MQRRNVLLSAIATGTVGVAAGGGSPPSAAAGLDLQGLVLVGHSMGCGEITEGG
jgi:hypothetical protein